MNPETKALISNRAQRIFVFARDYLMYRDESDFEIGEALKFSSLLLYGPSKYRQTFSNGRLDVDPEAVNAIYWDQRTELPGAGGLLNEERLLIRNHNSEVDRLLSSEGQSDLRFQAATVTPIGLRA